MNFDHRHYVPCLRWKQGEYQAVWRLPKVTKQKFTPLIEIPEIGWDFEEGKEKKTIDEHLADFALKKVYKKWGNSFCFVDLNLINPSERMANGSHPVRFVFDELRAMNCSAIPVTGLSRDTKYQQEIREILKKDKKGLCLRVKIELAAKSTFKTGTDSLLAMFKIKPSDCDLILDLGAPNFEPLDGFSKAIQAIVNKIPYLNIWRTFSILGTSFPETMAGIKLGVKIIPRYEWQLYKKLIHDFKKINFRLPTFGDYTISHPEVPIIDMRMVKPSATIRYTFDDGWYIAKGKNVRDYGFRQYRVLSRQVQDSRYYCGPNFSWGDQYIDKCANGSGSTGNLTTWRQVGTNHHIEKVTRDIASFYGSLGTL
ncbi:MAG: beta family protein [Sedimentisphaerales bacterium]|nr:beta family protein [Sedimentisphaerales bacterium]